MTEKHSGCDGERTRVMSASGEANREDIREAHKDDVTAGDTIHIAGHVRRVHCVRGTGRFVVVHFAQAVRERGGSRYWAAAHECEVVRQ